GIAAGSAVGHIGARCDAGARAAVALAGWTLIVALRSDAHRARPHDGRHARIAAASAIVHVRAEVEAALRALRARAAAGSGGASPGARSCRRAGAPPPPDAAGARAAGWGGNARTVFADLVPWTLGVVGAVAGRSAGTTALRAGASENHPSEGAEGEGGLGSVHCSSEQQAARCTKCTAEDAPSS